MAFQFDLTVTNLSAFELGGLLWLLTLERGHFLRLGLGEPLEFGRVREELVPAGTRLADGAAWAAALRPDPPTDAVDRDALVGGFRAAVEAANPDLLQAFRTAAAGWDHLPVHYPRRSLTSGRLPATRRGVSTTSGSLRTSG